MRRLAILTAVLLAPIALPAAAQISNSPLPASAAPSSEVVGGALGSDTTSYALANHQHPRISRAMTATTISGGTFSGTWATPLPANPMLILTPIATGGAAITCELTATPTTTAFAGRCWTSQTTTLNLGIITAGLTLLPNVATAAGVSVQVIAIPPTQ